MSYNYSNNVINDIIKLLADNKMRGAFVPISRLEDLARDRDEVKGGGFQSKHIEWWLSATEKLLPDDLGFEPKSIITVTAGSPKVALRFNYKGAPVDCILPPTYAAVSASEKGQFEFIQETIRQFGNNVKSVGLIPQKLLAVHSCLGKFGRNNIFYDDEFGSYAKIITFVTDVPCDGDAPWRAAVRMESCESCLACVAACPTKAIDANRRMINADICITALNERDGEFPDWLDKSAHNALIGCVMCQDCCPTNERNLDNIVRGVEFDESETLELLACGTEKPIPGELAAKFESAGIWKHFTKHLPRNLAALL